MKVGIEVSESLDVALLDGDHVIGTLALKFSQARAREKTPVTRDAAPVAAKSVRKQRKPMSDETKAKMKAAQQKRWAEKRGAVA